MDNALGVQMLQSLERLAAYRRNLALSHDIECHDIRQATSLHVLHRDPQIATNKVTINKVHNIRMRAILHHQDLVDNQILLRLLLEVHLLDRDAAVGHALVRHVDTTRRSLPNLG